MRDYKNKTASILWIAIMLCSASAVVAQTPNRAVVTFSSGAYGTLTAAVDGVPIASGDFVDVGKRIVFTAVPSPGYGNVLWWVNGAVLNEPSSMYTIMVRVSNAAPLDVMAVFEWGQPPCAKVTFRAAANGSVTAVVDGVRIASGDSVLVGKTIVFTAVPSVGYGNTRWRVNGAEMPDTSMSLIARVSNAAPLNVVAAFEQVSSIHAKVTFRAVANGTVTAAADGVPIASGDSVLIGKSVVFTGVPDKGYGNVRWWVNGTEAVDTSMYSLTAEISTADEVNVTAAFEIYVEPPPDALSGVLTFGPNPIRSGDVVRIYWKGNKDIGGELLVFNAMGENITSINVNGMGEIGAWDTRGIGRGTYLTRGMLRDKDGFKCGVLMLIGVVK
jgi:predicted RecA/RadA family phage recombinase